jgi:hypothetical protein
MRRDHRRYLLVDHKRLRCVWLIAEAEMEIVECGDDNTLKRGTLFRYLRICHLLERGPNWEAGEITPQRGAQGQDGGQYLLSVDGVPLEGCSWTELDF